MDEKRSKMAEINKKFACQTTVTWDKGKNTFCCSFGKKVIEIAASGQFQECKDIWTPEELFLASLKGFLQESFINCAKANNFEFLSYESNAEGVVEKSGDKLMFTEIEIRPHIVVYSSSQIEKARDLVRTAKDKCFIFSSLAAMVMVYPEIKTKF